MTREEQITYKAGSIADGCIAHGAPWKEYYQGFIEGAKWADANPFQPSLPSDLDEAAEEFTRNEYSSPCAFGGENIEEWVSRMFKAGAEWMAGQGVHLNAVVNNFGEVAVLNYPNEDDNISRLIADNFEQSDKVVVQIRKK